MQDVVDYRGIFLYIHVDWPGKVHDARVFSNSSLYLKGQKGTLLLDWKEDFGGKMCHFAFSVTLNTPSYYLYG